MRAIMRGLTDAAFERLYGTEDQCLAAWVKVRQAAGMSCPRCDNPKSYVYDRRVGCTRCDMRWSITSGSVMADTKLPLTIWFRAMHLMSSTKQCISAVELGRRLGVSYPTAWYLHKRLRHAMTQESDRCQLGAPAEGGWTPIVEADDVYLGGERNEGSGTAGKTRVIAAAERWPSGRMGAVVMRVVNSFSNQAAAAFRDSHIAPGAVVHTDGTKAFGVFGEAGRTHVATVTGGKRPERERGGPFFNVNTLISMCGRPLGCKRKMRSLTGGSIAIMCPALSTRHHVRWPRWVPRSSPKQSRGLESHGDQRVLWIVGSTDRHLIQLFHPGIDAWFELPPADAGRPPHASS